MNLKTPVCVPDDVDCRWAKSSQGLQGQAQFLALDDFFSVGGIRGQLSTKTGAQNLGSIQNSVGKILAKQEGQLCSRCGCLRKGGSGLCLLQHSLSQVLSVLWVSFSHHLIPIHIYFCPQLSSTCVQIPWHCLLGALAGFSQGFHRSGFDVLAQQSQGARGGSWQKVVDGGHNVTSHPASV